MIAPIAMLLPTGLRLDLDLVRGLDHLVRVRLDHVRLANFSRLVRSNHPAPRYRFLHWNEPIWNEPIPSTRLTPQCDWFQGGLILIDLNLIGLQNDRLGHVTCRRVVFAPNALGFLQSKDLRWNGWTAVDLPPLVDCLLNQRPMRIRWKRQEHWNLLLHCHRI